MMKPEANLLHGIKLLLYYRTCCLFENSSYYNFFLVRRFPPLQLLHISFQFSLRYSKINLSHGNSSLRYLSGAPEFLFSVLSSPRCFSHSLETRPPGPFSFQVHASGVLDAQHWKMWTPSRQPGHCLQETFPLT